MKFLIYSAVLFLCLSQLSLAGQAYFFESIQDLPLMQGLTELTDQTIVFDKPGGRIVESLADTNHLSRKSIQEYYASALPQFGWARIAEGNFVRGGELLALEFENIAGKDFLKITIAPK